MEVVGWLLAVALGEIVVLLGVEIFRALRRGKSGGEARDDEEESDYEKKWQEGVSAMMGYDLNTAKRAVRGDDEDGR